MKNIAQALREIKNKPFTFIIFFLQISVSFIMLFFAITEGFVGVKETYKAMDKIKGSNISHLNATESPNTASFKKQVDAFIKINKEYDTFINDYGYTMIYHLKCRDELLKDGFEDPITTLSVNNNFYNLLDLRIKDGNGFITDDFRNHKNSVPIIMGSYFKKHYKIGEEIKFRNIDNLANKKINKMKVLGFLDEGTTVPDPLTTEQNLDRIIVFAIDENYENYLDDGARVLWNSIHITSENNKEDDTKLKKIGKDIGYTFQLTKWESFYKSYIELYKGQLIQYVTLFLFTVTLGMLGIISALTIYIKENSYEIGIHFLSGDSISKFMFRFIFQILTITIASLVSVTSFITVNRDYLGIMLLVAVIVDIIILSSLYKNLREKKIVDYLRRKE